MNIQWKYIFSNTILQRGRQYYEEGAVYNATKSGGNFEAIVMGESMYTVKLTLNGIHVSSIECSCPYAHKGNYCKHMAAVLFAIENDEYEEGYVNQKQSNKKKKPANKRARKPEQVILFPQE